MALTSLAAASVAAGGCAGFAGNCRRRRIPWHADRHQTDSPCRTPRSV